MCLIKLQEENKRILHFHRIRAYLECETNMNFFSLYLLRKNPGDDLIKMNNLGYSLYIVIQIFQKWTSLGRRKVFI
jgi:hypothetical protein